MENETGQRYEMYQNRFVIFVSSPRQKTTNEPPPHISPADRAYPRRFSSRKSVRFARSAEIHESPHGDLARVRNRPGLQICIPRRGRVSRHHCTLFIVHCTERPMHLQRHNPLRLEHHGFITKFIQYETFFCYLYISLLFCNRSKGAKRYRFPPTRQHL